MKTYFRWKMGLHYSMASRQLSWRQSQRTNCVGRDLIRFPWTVWDLILLRCGSLLPWGSHPYSESLRQCLTTLPKEYGAILFIVISYIAAGNSSLSPISIPSLVWIDPALSAFIPMYCATDPDHSCGSSWPCCRMSMSLLHQESQKQAHHPDVTSQSLGSIKHCLAGAICISVLST